MVSPTINSSIPSTEQPIDRFLSQLKGYKEYSRGYTSRCPSHNDSEASLMIWEDEADGHVGLKCFSGCSRKAIVESVGMTERDLYPVTGNGVYHQPSQRSLTVCDLVIDKLIPPAILSNLGIMDSKATYTKRKGRPCDPYDAKGVVIPYYTKDGTPYSRFRLRTSIKAKDGTFWNEGTDPIIPYGLHKLPLAREQEYLLIGEGESDAWTCWLYGIPYLGIPGASNVGCLNGNDLHAIARVFVIQEPDIAG